MEFEFGNYKLYALPALQGLKTFAVACCGLGPHFLQWIIYQS